MKLINLGCGGERFAEPGWVHLDDLHSQLSPGSGARIQLDSESQYMNFVVGSGPLPFDDGSVSGILASHFFEHWHAQDALAIMKDCLRILEPGGCLLVSVPDASYFRRVYPEDRNENWPRLFDTTDPNNPIPTFHEAACWFSQHMQILTEDALWSHFVMAGFPRDNIHRINPDWITANGEIWIGGVPPEETAQTIMCDKLNRLKFSLVMSGVKGDKFQ